MNAGQSQVVALRHAKINANMTGENWVCYWHASRSMAPGWYVERACEHADLEGKDVVAPDLDILHAKILDGKVVMSNG